MSAIDQIPGVPPVPSGDLRFGCPSCAQELSIPATLAGVEGPCPHCRVGIAAPVPSANQPARLLLPPPSQVPPLSAPPVISPPPAPPLAPPPAVQLETRQVICQACGCELAIDPSLAHLPGGPCPRCQTWIDLSGRQSAPAVSPSPPPAVSPSSPASLPSHPQPPSRRRGPSGAGVESSSPVRTTPPVSELNQKVTDPSMGMNFPKLENLAAPSYSPPADEVEERGERRRVKRRKRKRQLPPEFYVGHAAGELDARGQESAGRMRKSQFPEEGNERRTRRRHVSDEESDDGESALAKCLPVVFGVLIPLIGGLFAALHFDIVKPENLRFWESKSPVSSPGDDLLARQVEQTDQALDAKAQEAYSAVQTTFTQFLEAETWEDAEKYLSWEQVPEDSEAPSFLKMFPRDAYRRAKVRLIDYARIPKTERFIFTTHLANGIDAMGEPLITFLIGEQQEEGNPKIHGLQLYQSWKATLKEFLETTGSTRDRFYVRLRTTSPKTTITFPDDGDYVKLELEDFLVKRPWSKEVYVRKDSYAGTRLLPTLTSEYSLAIVDLEWLKGPTGDVFVHVAGLHSSTWGDFHK